MFIYLRIILVQKHLLQVKILKNKLKSKLKKLLSELILLHFLVCRFQSFMAESGASLMQMLNC